MHALVTGSSGTIGTRLCEKLLERGDTVTGMDWVPNKWQKSVDAITLQVDLRDDAALAVAAKNIKGTPDMLIHLAANARVYELVEDPTKARDNFCTLFNALEYARTSGIKRFVFASSREGYGNLDADTLTEDLVRVENCESPYTASKVGGEALVHAYARCYGLETVIFRFSNVYGMYDDSQRVVPLFIRLARANKLITVFGEKKCLDFTYIDDTVNGILQTIDAFQKAKGGTYNLAFGEGNTISGLAALIKELTHSTSPVHMGKPRTGEIIRYVADISLAKKTFGYDPKVSFDEGVRKAVEWYAAHT